MANKRPTGNPYSRTHNRAAYRSGLEVAVSAALALAGIPFTYEAVKLPFTEPAKSRTYCPDFITAAGLVVETKGRFETDDRAKHLLIKAQHPDIKIAFVFTNPNAKLRKGSPTSYADWCEKHGFRYARKEIPKEWLEEPADLAALAALKTLGWKPSS